VDDARVVDAAQRANIHEMVLRLPRGYDTPIEETARLLSAGQRQRVALARALYGDPRLVVLDEPNSNLDTDGEHSLASSIRALKARGVTVVVITHRASLLSASDKVLTLREGVVERFGPASEILPRVVMRAPAVA
jgi:ATP-binding cassette, subfamily C, bacterial EexD